MIEMRLEKRPETLRGEGVQTRRQVRGFRTYMLATIWILAALMTIAGLISADEPAKRSTGILVVVVVVFGFVGLGVLIVVRSSNLIGWFFCVAGLLMTYQYWAWARGTGSTEEYLLDSIVYFASLLIIPTLILVFPDGRLPGRRWRTIAWLGVGAAATAMVSSLFAPTIWGTDDPAPLAGIMPEAVRSTIDVLGYVLLIPFLVAVVASPIIRFRRASGVERRQLKMFGYGAAMAFTIGFVPQAFDFPIGDVVSALGLMALPLSIAAAILRYRLYDIDRLISRTVGYGIVAVAIALIYVAGAVWLPTLVAGEQSSLFVAASTLAVAALFNPLRRRVIRWADRRFFRSRYDSDHVLTEFGRRLKAGVGIDRLTEDSLSVISQTVQPSSVGLWIRE